MSVYEYVEHSNNYNNDVNTSIKVNANTNINTPLYIPITNTDKIWRKTLAYKIFRKKNPSLAWKHQLIRILNRKYKKKYNITTAYILNSSNNIINKF